MGSLKDSRRSSNKRKANDDETLLQSPPKIRKGTQKSPKRSSTPMAASSTTTVPRVKVEKREVSSPDSGDDDKTCVDSQTAADTPRTDPHGNQRAQAREDRLLVSFDGYRVEYTYINVSVDGVHSSMR